jgi:hypothetical protein
MTNAPLPVVSDSRDGPAVDEFFEADRISGEMAAVGGLILRGLTDQWGATQAILVARRVFAAMRSVEARQCQKAPGPGGEFPQTPAQNG